MRSAKSRVHARITTDPGVRISLTIAFDSDKIGPERTAKVWDGLGAAIAAALDPDQASAFREQLEAELAKVERGGR